MSISDLVFLFIQTQREKEPFLAEAESAGQARAEWGPYNLFDNNITIIIIFIQDLLTVCYHHVRGYSNEKHRWLFLTHEVYFLEEKAVTKISKWTEVDFLQDVSQRPLLLNVHILYYAHPRFSKFGLCNQ